jgi:hypothetical protein
MFSHLKEGLTAAMKTSHEYIFSTHLCHAFFTDISIGNHAMASIQLGINSTSDRFGNFAKIGRALLVYY